MRERQGRREVEEDRGRSMRGDTVTETEPRNVEMMRDGTCRERDDDDRDEETEIEVRVQTTM